MTILIPMFIGVAGFAAIWGIGYAIHEKIVYDINVFDGILAPIVEKLNYKKMELARANQLYICSECQKLSRRYQQTMYISRHGIAACPHCEQKINANRYQELLSEHPYSSPKIPLQLARIPKEDSWMATHGDCPKITKQGHKEVQKTIILMKNLRAEEQEVERFKRYNKLEIDYSWIENLHKEEEKPVERE